ncbi:MAG: DUF6090 family protein [Robiginitalea sp.]|uniref:DUF6090 family protein n=1 Tax=Robiginitalea sp. TaxID=1902411 RepID=UPI003C739390
MLRFFRNIRQSLLTDNKISKYVLYAIGEILLVVVGILIALQVDSWKNAKENDLQAQKVLSALFKEFTKNKAQLIRVKSYHSRVISASNDLLDLIAQSPEKYNERVMDSLLAEYSYFMTFNPYNSALEASISSGDIHLIENDSLINLLFSYPAMVSDANEEEFQSKQLLFQHKEAFLYEYIREVDIWSDRGLKPQSNRKSPFKSNYSGLLKNPVFENTVYDRQGIVQELVNEQNTILEVNNLILKLIKEEMK